MGPASSSAAPKLWEATKGAMGDLGEFAAEEVALSSSEGPASGNNARIGPLWLLCFRTTMVFPVSTSNNRRVPSMDPAATIRPPKSDATQLTSSVCPVKLIHTSLSSAPNAGVFRPFSPATGLPSSPMKRPGTAAAVLSELSTPSSAESDGMGRASSGNIKMSMLLVCPRRMPHTTKLFGAMGNHSSRTAVSGSLDKMAVPHLMSAPLRMR
mmetsp:Transcript_163399/g.523939  ORF Transcript_163399/g.523939 Transcript_163399/m.523939 type:complete len:211 (+) Transcript_163399:2782-3414(+)